MPDWAWFIFVLAGYLFVMRWLLPKMGIPT
jgi:hypothetical protein